MLVRTSFLFFKFIPGDNIKCVAGDGDRLVLKKYVVPFPDDDSILLVNRHLIFHYL